MGTYSFWEFYETFGGLPEPGETYPGDPDLLREQYEEDQLNAGGERVARMRRLIAEENNREETT